MNAQELYEIVKVWPKEAWPQGVEWQENPRTVLGWWYNLTPLDAPLAEALFRDSGLAWLLSQPAAGLNIGRNTDGRMLVWPHGQTIYGWLDKQQPTLLAAIDNAIHIHIEKEIALNS